MQRQGWTRENLTDPISVYQLALWMGSSYSATCYALRESAAVDRSTCEKLLKVKPKAIKQSLVKPYEPAAWYGDVWLVTERDHGMVLQGSRSDLVVLKFQEHSGSGYVWQFEDLADTGLAIRDDGRRAAMAGKEHRRDRVSNTDRRGCGRREWSRATARSTPLAVCGNAPEFIGTGCRSLRPRPRGPLAGTARSPAGSCMNPVTVHHDLRGRFGPARDQGARETCLAFATSDAHAAARGDPWTPLSCEYLFYCAKQRDTTPAHLGTTLRATRAALEHDGQPPETARPYLHALPADLAKWKPPAVDREHWRLTPNCHAGATPRPTIPLVAAAPHGCVAGPVREHAPVNLPTDSLAQELTCTRRVSSVDGDVD